MLDQAESQVSIKTFLCKYFVCLYVVFRVLILNWVVLYSWKMEVLGKILMPQWIMEQKKTEQTVPSSLKLDLVDLETGKVFNCSFGIE